MDHCWSFRGLTESAEAERRRWVLRKFANPQYYSVSRLIRMAGPSEQFCSLAVFGPEVSLGMTPKSIRGKDN